MSHSISPELKQISSIKIFKYNFQFLYMKNKKSCVGNGNYFISVTMGNYSY